jgi:hypothetical protein
MVPDDCLVMSHSRRQDSAGATVYVQPDEPFETLASSSRIEMGVVNDSVEGRVLGDVVEAQLQCTANRSVEHLQSLMDFTVVQALGSQDGLTAEDEVLLAQLLTDPYGTAC